MSTYAKVGAVDEDHEEQELHEGQQPTVEVAAGPEPEDAITVKVKSTDEKTHNVRVSASETVAGLKRMLEGTTGLPPARQRLICLGRLLMDEKTLKESNVKDETFVHLVPKPAAACAAEGADSEGGAGGQRGAAGLDEMRIPVHIQEMLIARGELPRTSFDHTAFSFEEEYEMSIWRYRVRVMSMLMLFYYFLTFMTSISIYLRPDDDDEANYQDQQGQFRQVKSDIPLALVDTLENVLGIIVSFSGLQAAVRDSPRIARKFARELCSLAVVHFINLFMWIAALFRHEIVRVPPPHRYEHMRPKDDEEAIRSIVGAMLIVHPMIWIAMVSIAFRYYKLLVQREMILAPIEASPANEESNDPPVATAVDDEPTPSRNTPQVV
ncbi:Ubiquitin [Hondaea fermentalgiana]|uniref:Ubiquitin n=1 Tax=Hondaea fermentalgiana TaxID=2315210 RepID=A0A2R5GQ23_9STRA|nr:Ubiquitin [Hondaea fermentalgiana]|eukprot:GBG31878.1 Ubiquitin [Hondaea fermentalgiana]